MTTRAQVNQLSDAGRRLVEMAKRDLDVLLRMIDLSSPERARDALLDVMPALVREYGELASVAAYEWYEAVRVASGVVSSHRMQLSMGVEAGRVQAGVRFAAGHLFGDDPLSMVGLLGGMLQRYIMYSARDTVQRNVAGDSAKPRFARVPTGAKTCAFCEMIASRGFVYHSRRSAGAMSRFHNDCDCQIVPEFDADGHHIDGYDPDAMYDRYEAARVSAGSGDPKAIAAEMRRLFPDQYTDGVH